jgi:hypothetical protein
MRHLAFIASCSLFCFAGCSDPYPGRHAISGTVTLKGDPLKEGTIAFVPAGGQGSQAVLFITDGKFAAERKDGLLVGKYLVRISAADKKAGLDESEAGGPGGSANITFFDIIPAEWNVASKQEVAVKADGENVYQFEIPNAAVPKKSGRR